MRQAISLDAKKLDLMQKIMSIDTDAVLDKVAKYVMRVAKTDKIQELSPETLTMIEQSRKEYEEGKVLSFESAADAQQWLEAL